MCFSDVGPARSVMPSYQGQPALLFSWQAAGIMIGNARGPYYTRGTAPNTIPYVLPSDSSFSSGPLLLPSLPLPPPFVSLRSTFFHRVFSYLLSLFEARLVPSISSFYPRDSFDAFSSLSVHLLSFRDGFLFHLRDADLESKFASAG